MDILCAHASRRHSVVRHIAAEQRHRADAIYKAEISFSSGRCSSREREVGKLAALHPLGAVRTHACAPVRLLEAVAPGHTPVSAPALNLKLSA